MAKDKYWSKIGCFLATKAFQTEYIGQYKLRKAYSFYRSGFANKIFVRVIDVSKVIIRSSVTPSVTTGFWSCTAGYSKYCNHIAAVLHKIE